jgi:hypothetical protein
MDDCHLSHITKLKKKNGDMFGAKPYIGQKL